MTRQGVLAETVDLGVAHAVEVIVFLIVLPHVVHAEVEIFTIAAAALRRLVGPGLSQPFHWQPGARVSFLAPWERFDDTRMLSKYLESSFIGREV